MESIGISEFKARCIALLKAVQATNEPLTVTHRGKPLVRIEPIHQESRVLGGLRERGEIRGDIVNFDFADEWEMTRD